MLLVPILVLSGTAAAVAAPLGLVSVAAASIAAGAVHLDERTTNHRIGVVVEIAASTGAITGVLLAGGFSDATLTRLLAVAAIAAALLGASRKGMRNLPSPDLDEDDIGETPGKLAGAYRVAGGRIVPYEANRLGRGLALMSVAGLVAGLSGTGGGFLKTPALSEVMHVPVKVAASTVTFTAGITAASGLLVFAAQGRLDVRPAAAVVVGSLLGGQLGAHAQSRLSPPVVRRFLSVVLGIIGTVLLVRG